MAEHDVKIDLWAEFRRIAAEQSGQREVQARQDEQLRAGAKAFGEQRDAADELRAELAAVKADLARVKERGLAPWWKVALAVVGAAGAIATAGAVFDRLATRAWVADVIASKANSDPTEHAIARLEQTAEHARQEAERLRTDLAATQSQVQTLLEYLSKPGRRAKAAGNH